MSELAYFIVIPASVWNDKSLSPAAERLYGRISGLTKMRGYCFASNTHFANLLGTTPRSVQRWLMELKRAGHITIELEGPLGNERKIWLTHSTTNLSPPHDKKGNDKHDKIVVENSTKNNVLKTKSTPTPKVSEFLDTLRADPYFEGIDIDAEYERAVLWCEKKNRALTQRFFRDWLNRADRLDLAQDEEQQPVEAEVWTEEKMLAALQLYPGMLNPPPAWEEIPLDVQATIEAQVKLNQAHEKTPGCGNAGANVNGQNGGGGRKREAEKAPSGDSASGTQTTLDEGQSVSAEDVQK
jgi:hypothetical protein